MNSPVYLLASERSGTNLLRRRFTESQLNYWGPSPAHFLKNLFFRESLYGSLVDDINFLKLIEDSLGLCYIHFSPWEIHLKKDDILTEYSQNYKKRNVIILAHFLMQKYANYKGFQTYFCKDNHLFNFAFAIKKELPDVKFIYLYRDPRDYILSQLKRTLQVNSIYNLAQMWREEQRKSFACFHYYKQDCITLSYENLIQNEEQQLKRICNFLHVQYCQPQAVSGIHDTGLSEEWQNLNKPTMTDNAGKYRKELNRSDIRIIEHICWREMQHLGYVPEHTERPLKPTKFSLFVEIYLKKMITIGKSYIKKQKNSETFSWAKDRQKFIRNLD